MFEVVLIFKIKKKTFLNHNAGQRLRCKFLLQWLDSNRVFLSYYGRTRRPCGHSGRSIITFQQLYNYSISMGNLALCFLFVFCLFLFKWEIRSSKLSESITQSDVDPDYVIMKRKNILFPLICSQILECINFNIGLPY